MKIVYGIAQSDLLRRPSVTTFGVFDGLHLGHQLIMKTLVERSKVTGYAATVVTFLPYPRQVLDPTNAPIPLQTFDQKMEGLEKLGIEQVLVIEFTKEFAATTAEAFTKEILLDRLASREVYLGEGFVFGHGRKGNIDKLRELALKYGFFADQVPEVLLRGCRISSALIRELLLTGQVNLARRMLGRPYGIEGIVCNGRKLGRELNFPTANLHPINAIVPANGVYITLVLVDGRWHRSVTNVGIRPTVTDEPVCTVETHILDFDRDIYGQKLRLRFLHRIRNEQRFASIAQLRDRIALDTKLSIRYFERQGVRNSLEYV
ncbi:MAG: bifunctional riboflavin kinase/FAD synthetase [Acidobacteriota bacterium]|nr:bifunctional riboflavin kinase/FAD synthetase [Blastocatellia bacterium]MDW8411481.1 bifunctional riboflavin kinase/FAD synthetase [Acidobacteriota bacterium]